jgi:hypothetical protein
MEATAAFCGTTELTLAAFNEWRIECAVFSALLHEQDARRASEVAAAVLAHDLRCALAGGLAIAAQLRAHGRPAEQKRLGDIDLVVDGFDAIPTSVAASFLLNHVHPDAAEGKTLLQLIDEPHAVRVDLFRAFGNTLRRAHVLDNETGALNVLSVEDLVARTTALVCGALRQGRRIDVKHATAFRRLRGLGEEVELAVAWNEHRQDVPGTLDEAVEETLRLLDAHPELVVVEEYSAEIVTCGRCRAHWAFQAAPACKIVEILGYC